MLLYLHLRNSKIFFILKSLTTSKMRQFQTIKLSQFHKAKTCWTENCWSSGIMSNFIVYRYFQKKFEKHKKIHSKVAHNPIGHQSSNFLLCETETVLKSEIFSSLNLSNFSGWKMSSLNRNGIEIIGMLLQN